MQEKELIKEVFLERFLPKSWVWLPLPVSKRGFRVSIFWDELARLKRLLAQQKIWLKLLLTSSKLYEFKSYLWEFNHETGSRSELKNL